MEKILQRPIGLIFVLLVAIIGGLFAIKELSISMYPSIQKPKISVWFNTGGLDTLTSYETYSRPIYDAIETIEGVTFNETDYYQNSVGVHIEFDYDKDKDKAKQEVTLAFEGLRSSLPEDLRNSVWVGFDSQGQGSFAAMLYSDAGRPSQEIYDLTRPVIDPALAKVKDVNQSESGVNTVHRYEVVIEFDQVELARHGLYLPRVLGEIKGQIANFPSGQIKGDRRTVTIRTVMNEKKVEDLQNVILSTKTLRSGEVVSVRVVTLQDVAKVFLDKKPPNRIWRSGGQPANFLSVEAVPGGNLWAVSAGTKKILNGLYEMGLPKDIKFQPYLDPSQWIGSAIRNMLFSAGVGTLIAILVILIFLGSIKSTFLIAISIPSSLILSFIGMRASDININMISLGGMALAVGMIVDSSIVVLENIFRVFEARQPSTWEERRSAISAAVKEVGWPVVISTMTSIIVFLPLSFTSAMANAILGDMSRVVVFALCFSVFAALLYLPIFSRYLVGAEKKPLAIAQRWNRCIAWICERFYLRTLRFFLANKLRSSVFICATFAVMISIVWPIVELLKKEIIAEPDASIFRLNLHAKYVNDKEDFLRLALPLEEKLKQDKYADLIDGFVTDISDKWGSIRVLVKKSTDVEAFTVMLEEDFPSTPDLRINIGQWNPTSMPLPKKNDVKVVFDPFTTADFDDAEFLCDEFEQRGNDEESPFSNIYCRPWGGIRKEIQIRPDRYKLKRLAQDAGLSLSPNDLSTYVRTASDQNYVGEIFLDGRRTKIYAKYPENSVKNVEDIENLLISLDAKQRAGTLSTFSLKTFADVVKKNVPPMIKVVEGARNVVAYGNLKSEFKESKTVAQEWVSGKVKEIRDAFPEHKAAILQENPYEEIDKSLSSLSFSLFLSLLLILCVLVLQFQSILQSLIVMLAIPLGIFGVAVSLWLFGSTLSLNSMLGIILLAGIAVNNSILIVDFYRSMKSSAENHVEALLSAVRIRFRPILMTMLTTIFAMLPIALGIGSGGKTLQPLGVAVSGGLLFSTIFTLLIVPMALHLAEKKS